MLVLQAEDLERRLERREQEAEASVRTLRQVCVHVAPLLPSSQLTKPGYKPSEVLNVLHLHPLVILLSSLPGACHLQLTGRYDVDGGIRKARNA
jgi:hypothetical protein